MPASQRYPAPEQAHHGLLLTFTKGGRPDRTAVADALARAGRTIALTAGVTAQQARPGWLELLYDGLTFDCLGLSPGPALDAGTWRSRVGFGAAVTTGQGEEAIGLFAGPHVGAAAGSLPVVRTQLAIARSLVRELPGIVSAGWTASGLEVAPDYFADAVDGWLAGRAFPALVLVAFSEAEGGAVETDGLAFFTGQELRIAPTIAESLGERIQLSARLIHELVATPAVTEDQSFTASDGRILRLRSDPGRTIIAVEGA